MIRNVKNRKCKVLACKYNVKSFCGLNVMGKSDLIEDQCIPTNNWHVIGSFVLDRIFERNTARDIDLVMPEHEMPVSLPMELVDSDLVIEMVWQPSEDRRGFDFYNISLPRISHRGFENYHVAKELKKYRKIQTLPGTRKIHVLSFFGAIKTMAKYDLEPDTKTIEIWKRSVISPLSWRKELGCFFMKYTEGLTGRPHQWDYVRAEYLISSMERVYQVTADREKQKYLACLREVLLMLDLKDLAYTVLLEYVNAKIKGDIEKINQYTQNLMTVQFEQKRDCSVLQTVNP